jgi:hypothetical protein
MGDEEGLQVHDLGFIRLLISKGFRRRWATANAKFCASAAAGDEICRTTNDLAMPVGPPRPYDHRTCHRQP